MKSLFLVLLLLVLVWHELRADYYDDIQQYKPNHHWPFEANLWDYPLSTPYVDGTASGMVNNSAVAISLNSGSSLELSGAGHVKFPDNVDINLGTHSERTWMAWIVVKEDFAPSVIYKEGGATNNFAVIAMAGGSIGAQVVMSNTSPSVDKQLWANTKLSYNVPYHFAFSYKKGGQFKIYLNGQVQQEADVEASIVPHGADIGVSLSEQLKIGGVSVTLQRAKMKIAHMALWTKQLEQSQIYDIFRKGALEIYSNFCFKNLDSNSSIALFKLDAIGGFVVGQLSSPISQIATSGDTTISYPVQTSQFARALIRKYGYIDFTTDIELTRFDNQLFSFFQIDPNISQPNISIVENYTQVENLNQLYDILKLWEYKNPSFSDNLINVVGSSLRLRNGWKIIFDKSAANVLNVNEITQEMVLKADLVMRTSKFSRLENSDSEVYARNGSFLNFAYIDRYHNSYVTIRNVEQDDTITVVDQFDKELFKQIGEFGFAYNATASVSYKLFLSKKNGIKAMKKYTIDKSGIDNEFSLSFNTANNLFLKRDRLKLFEAADKTQEEMEEDQGLIQQINSWIIMLTKQIQKNP